MDDTESDFLDAASLEQLVPGPYLAAWQVSYLDFQSIPDLTDAQKNLIHYKFGFTHNTDDYIILYQALLLPEMINGKPTGTIRATFGQSAKYWVDRKSLTIRKRLFLR